MANGRVTRVIGPVVDVEFPPDAMPADARVLYDLMLTFVETAHPIELKWKQTDIENGMPPEQLRFHGPSAEPAFGR